MPADGHFGSEQVDHVLLKGVAEVKRDVFAWSDKAERLLNALIYPDSTDESVAPLGRRVDRETFEALYRKPLRAIVAVLNDHTGPATFPSLPSDHPLQSVRTFIHHRQNSGWANQAERTEIQLELERLIGRFDDVDFVGTSRQG